MATMAMPTAVPSNNNNNNNNVIDDNANANNNDIGNTAYTVKYGICSAPPNAVTTSVSFNASKIEFANAMQ